MASAPAVVSPFAGAVVFEVAGEPRPQGSKQAYVVKGRAIVTERGRATLGPWRAQIAATAAGLLEEPLTGPLAVCLAFTFTRPKSHYRTGRHAAELRDDAPRAHSTRPDVDKLARAVLDALTGIAFRDDGQVSELSATKRFSDRAGVTVTIAPLEATR